MRIIILLLIISLSILASCGTKNSNNNSTTSDSLNVEKKDKKLKLNPKIVLTKHAQCRMDCRKIDIEEIKEVISKGQINPKKSEPKKKPCPLLAMEGITSKEKQKIRVVLAACKEETKIITVIDLNQKVDDPSCKNCK
jgi:hypothetical protein